MYLYKKNIEFTPVERSKNSKNSIIIYSENEELSCYGFKAFMPYADNDPTPDVNVLYPVTVNGSYLNKPIGKALIGLKHLKSKKYNGKAYDFVIVLNENDVRISEIINPSEAELLVEDNTIKAINLKYMGNSEIVTICPKTTN